MVGIRERHHPPTPPQGGGELFSRGWRIRPGVLCRDVCAFEAYREAARLPHARPDPKGRMHHDKRRRDVCATYDIAYHLSFIEFQRR